MGKIPGKRIIIVFMLALFFRLTLFVIYHPWGESGFEKLMVGDAYGYQTIAENLVKGNGYAPDNPFLSTLRTPGYPVFIAAVYFIFGIKPWLVILAQIVMDSALAVLIAKFALLLFGNLRTSFIAGLLWALEPFAIFYSNKLLSDGLFVFLVVLSFFFFLRFLKITHKRNLFASGILLGMATLTRPISIYLFIPVSIFAFFRFKSKVKGFQNVFIFVVIFLLTIAPWVIRNKLVHNHYFFSTSFAYNALILYAIPLLSFQQNTPEKELKKIESKNLYDKYAELSKSDPVIFYQKFKDRAVRIMKNNPLTFLKSFFLGIADMYFSTERKSFEHFFHIHSEDSPDFIDSLFKDGVLYFIKQLVTNLNPFTVLYIFIMLSVLFIQYFFAAFGTVSLVKMNAWQAIFILFIPILYFTFITGIAGIGRFKLPVIPFYLLLVSWALSHKHNKYSTRKYVE